MTHSITLNDNIDSYLVYSLNVSPIVIVTNVTKKSHYVVNIRLPICRKIYSRLDTLDVYGIYKSPATNEYYIYAIPLHFY